MAEADSNSFLLHIRHLIGSVSAAALTDGELLERFLDSRDETAVEVLVRRYGPLVFGVCRRVLHNAHAAEDAFQATFLVLMRKASSLDHGKPLGNWLYTVAYRLALRARVNELRRQRCEELAARARLPVDSRVASPSDLVVALEEELHRLPERHRAPLVLCYFEGKTNDQAAEILGCPRGSMAARLAQAKERLRACLARRGFVAGASGIAAALATASAQAMVPLPLLDNTVRAALWFARGDACAAVFVSARAVALARGTVRTMFLNKLKIAGALLLAATMLGTGATVLLKAAPQAEPPAQASHQPPPEPVQRVDVRDAGREQSTNAALSYGQAFIALRRGTSDETKLIAECLTMPLDAHAREIATRAAYALRMMQRGAALPRCDWDIDFERGIKVPYNHGEGAEVLSALACLRARLRFEEGSNREAVEDILAALALARQVARDGTLDSLWAGYHIERRMGETLALYLPRLDAGMIKDLHTRLEALPPGGSAARATMRMEEAMLDWIAGEVKEAKDKESLLAFLSQLSGWKSAAPEKNRARGRALLEECGGTAAGVLQSTAGLRASSVPLAKTLDGAPDQVAKDLEGEGAKLAGNPVFKVFAPVLHNVRIQQTKAAIRRGLLSAALAVQSSGRASLKDHPDPVVGDAFDYVAFAGGYELRSKWKLDEGLRAQWKLDPQEPLELTVGRRGR